MEFIRAILKRVVPERLQERLREFRDVRIDNYAWRSYSQEGEDMILRKLFREQEHGFYVDVGAHHPRRFSNTYFYYRLGWSGINVDAMPGSMRLFEKMRPRDLNLECAVGNGNGEAKYFIFNDLALNTFDESLSLERNKKPYQIVRELKIQVRSLASILTQHVPLGQYIDFLNVDVEGMDLEVLQSNDWERFRPKYILVECLRLDLTELTRDGVFSFLSHHGYRPIAKTINTAIFEDTGPIHGMDGHD
jgi:FkbM family methyltransferase